MKLVYNYFLVLFVISSFLSCQQSPAYYKREFSNEEQLHYAEQLLSGMGYTYYYQGSTGELALLDEAEKADASIFDALLSVLDEGMFTDAYGRVTNFRNTIIILTTNLGASNQQSIGFGSTESDESKYLGAIEKFFRPEFINRIDNVIFFHPLEQEAILKISKKELAALNQLEGFVKRGIQLEFDDAVIKFLATVGFDKRYGARPLQRAIKTHVIAPMANWLLTHPAVKNQVLNLSYDNGLQVVLGKKM